MEKITAAVESASVYVVQHFDTVEKAAHNAAGLVIAALGVWLAKKAIASLNYAARYAYASAKARVSPPHDPVFARLLAHFDDPDAMYTKREETKTTANGFTSTNTVCVLETGKIVVRVVNSSTESVKENGYDIFPDLTPSEQMDIRGHISAKIKEVNERDRLARRANLSAPKAV